MSLIKFLRIFNEWDSFDNYKATWFHVLMLLLSNISAIRSDVQHWERQVFSSVVMHVSRVGISYEQDQKMAGNASYSTVVYGYEKQQKQ
jgi:hypothetical protein